MPKRLFIDLNQCDDCEYVRGRVRLLLPAARGGPRRAHAARRWRRSCWSAAGARSPRCVAACRFDALERQEDGRPEAPQPAVRELQVLRARLPVRNHLPRPVPFYMTPLRLLPVRRRRPSPPCVTSCRRGRDRVPRGRANRRRRTSTRRRAPGGAGAEVGEGARLMRAEAMQHAAWILQVLVFPGLLFTAAAGLVTAGSTARSRRACRCASGRRSCSRSTTSPS